MTEIAKFDRMIMAKWPEIEWCKPLGVEIRKTDIRRAVCRLCMARLGLKGSDVAQSPYCFETTTAFDTHMRQVHELGSE